MAFARGLRRLRPFVWFGLSRWIFSWGTPEGFRDGPFAPILGKCRANFGRSRHYRVPWFEERCCFRREFCARASRKRRLFWAAFTTGIGVGKCVARCLPPDPPPPAAARRVRGPTQSPPSECPTGLCRKGLRWPPRIGLAPLARPIRVPYNPCRIETLHAPFFSCPSLR